jgi:hypothetical protein
MNSRQRSSSLEPCGRVLGVSIRSGLLARASAWPRRAEELLRFRGADGRCYVAAEELAELGELGMPCDVEWSASERELPVHFSLADGGAFEDPPPRSARLAVLCRLLAQGGLQRSLHDERAPRPLEVEFLGRGRVLPPDAFVLDRSGGRRRYAWRVREGVLEGPPRSVPERFPALAAELSRPDARVVVSLGSGGLKLYSHVSVLRFLERLECAERIDELWGCSAGALIALLYCHGLSPESIEQTGYDLYAGRYQISFRPSRLQLLSALARELCGWTHHAVAGAGFVDCARGITGMIEHYCRDIRPTRPLYCVAYNLDRGRAEVLTPEPVPPDCAELFTRTDALEAALASSAVPLYFVPRRISCGGEAAHYIDGSTTEDVPLYSIVRKWDLDRAAGRESRERLVILAVKLTPRLGSARIPPGRVGKLAVVHTVASAAQEAIHCRDLALIAARPDIHLLSLQLGAGDDFFQPYRIPAYIQLAKADFAEQLAAIEQQLAARRAPAALRPRHAS